MYKFSLLNHVGSSKLIVCSECNSFCNDDFFFQVHINGILRQILEEAFPFDKKDKFLLVFPGVVLLTLATVVELYTNEQLTKRMMKELYVNNVW